MEKKPGKYLLLFWCLGWGRSRRKGTRSLSRPGSPPSYWDRALWSHLTSGAWACSSRKLVLAEKAYEGFRKGLAGGRSHLPVACLYTFPEDAFGEDKQAGGTSGETWRGRMWGWPVQVAVARGPQVRPCIDQERGGR